jgi:ribulose-phosphate 3-epimerase
MAAEQMLIAPSLLSADFSKLREEIARVEGGGADWMHVDVMDGHFVPNLTMGPFIVKAIHRAATTPLDVHLMIDDPATYAEEFAAAGASLLCYHVECREGGPETAEKIRKLGVRPGIAVRPDTPIEAIEDHLPFVEMVLVMSVMPGFSGQKFMPEVLDKTRAVREKYGFTGDVQMDGGVGPKTIAQCAEAGANVFVAGSAVFGAEDPAAAIADLKSRAGEARPIRR